MIVLDTSLLSLALRRRKRAPASPELAELEALLQSDTPLLLPGIVLQEILTGIPSEPRFQEIAAVLDGLPLLQAHRHVHQEAARIGNRCRSKGVSTSAIDCLIAAQTIAVDGRLFTLDTDFERMAEHTALRLYRSARQF